MEISAITLQIAFWAGIIAVCIISFRIVRMYFIYISTGKLGNIDNMMLENGFNLRWFLTETHPLPIIMDSLFMLIVIGACVILSPIFFYVIGVVATIFSIIWSAKYLRNKRVIKQNFVDALKGEEQ